MNVVRVPELLEDFSVYFKLRCPSSAFVTCTVGWAIQLIYVLIINTTNPSI